MPTVSSTTSTSTLVEQLIYIDSEPIRTAQTKIKELESKKTLLNSINTQVSNLQTATEDLYKALSEPSKIIKESKEGIASITFKDDTFKGNLSLSVQQLATNTILSGDKIEGPIGIAGSFKISIGGTEATIDITETDDIKSIRDKINKNEELGANASIIDGRLVLTSSETGEDTKFSFEDTDGILKKLGILDENGDNKNVLQEGVNSKFTINGISIENSSNSIEDVLEGVTIELTDVGDTTFKVSEDTDKLVESVEKFIEAYNKTLTMVSDELKKEGGSLRGDSAISKLKTDLRNCINTRGDGLFKLLSDIGIEFSSTNYGKDAKLEIKDKDKLKDALLKNKDDVLNLFVKDNNNNGKLDKKDGGILGVLNDYLNNAISTSSSNKGIFAIKKDSIDSSIKTLNSRIERLERTIEKKRTIYEKQFLQMDMYVEQMNNQLLGLTSMMTYSSSNSTGLF